VTTWANLHFKASNFPCDAGRLYFVPSVKKHGILLFTYRNRHVTFSNYHALVWHKDNTYTCVSVRERETKEGLSTVRGLELVRPAQICSVDFWNSFMSDAPVATVLAEHHKEIRKGDLDVSSSDKPTAKTPLRRSSRSRRNVINLAGARSTETSTKPTLRSPSASQYHNRRLNLVPSRRPALQRHPSRKLERGPTDLMLPQSLT
jgi:hypothetical protein